MFAAKKAFTENCIHFWGFSAAKETAAKIMGTRPPIKAATTDLKQLREPTMN